MVNHAQRLQIVVQRVPNYDSLRINDRIQGFADRLQRQHCSSVILRRNPGEAGVEVSVGVVDRELCMARM